MFHPQGPTFLELARQCLSSTERGYDLLAPKFDVTPFRTPDFLLDGLAKYLGPPRSIDAALDVCCGTGAAIRILRPLVRVPSAVGNALRGVPECHGGHSLQGRVVGIDFSRGMLEVAAKQVGPACIVGPACRAGPGAAERRPPAAPGSPRQGEPTVELIQGDVLEMDFREEFDLAVTVGSLGHILPKDEPRFVERIAAALKPGGRFAFVTTRMPPLFSARYLLSRGFNAAMHVRNAIKRPPFVMFYLRFLLPDVERLLAAHGFDVAVHNDAFPGKWRVLEVVVATKRGEARTNDQSPMTKQT